MLLGAAIEQLAHLDAQRLACTDATHDALFDDEYGDGEQAEDAVAQTPTPEVIEPYDSFVERFVAERRHEAFMSERERELLASDEMLLAPIVDDSDRERGHDAVMAAAKAVRASGTLRSFVFIYLFFFIKKKT